MDTSLLIEIGIFLLACILIIVGLVKEYDDKV